MGQKITETVQLNIKTALVDMESSLSQMQAAFNKLDVTQGAETKFNRLFSQISERIKSLQSTTKNGTVDIVDLKQTLKDIKAIGDKLRSVGIELDSFDFDSKGLKESAKAIDKMSAAQKECNKAQKEYNKELNTTLKKQKEVQAKIEEARKEANKSTKERKGDRKVVSQNTYNDLEKQLKEAQSQRRSLQAKKASASKKLDTRIEQEVASNSPLGQRIQENGKQARGLANTKEAQAVSKLNQQLEEADKNITNIKENLSNVVTKDQLTKEAENANRELKSLVQEADDLKDKINSLNADKTKDLVGYLKSATDIDWKSFGIDPDSIKTVEQFNAALDSLKGKSAEGAQEAVKELNNAFEDFKKNSGDVRDEVDSVKDSFSRLAQKRQDIDDLRQRLVSFFGIQNTIQLFRRAIQEAYQSVEELDAAMTETAVVTDFSVGDMWEQLPEYTKMANELGTTTLGAYETATLFYQQGLETNEVMQVSTETMKMARIAGMDYVEATNMMTAALRGFNMEINEVSAQRINDVYSELAKITASDTQEISTAMTKTASIANNANMEFETTAAFLSQIIETTRESAETAGTAMKTIIARFTELKKDPNGLINVDGEEVAANKVETALKSVGVSLRDTNGEFRALDQVFLDLAKKWDSLTTNQQRYIATMAAGSRQQSRFIAMMSNYDRTIELVNAAYNSSGSSQEQFEKTTESLESKVNKLKNAWQEFTMNLANSTVIKGAVDLLTMLLNVINKITTVGGTMSNSIISFAATLGLVIKAFSSLGKIYDKYGDKIFNGLKNISNLLDPTSITTDVQGGTEAGVKAAQAEVYEATRTSIFNATKNGMTEGAAAANISPESDKKADIIEDIKDSGNKEIPAKATEDIGDKLEKAVENSVPKTTAKPGLKQQLGSAFSEGLAGGRDKALNQWNELGEKASELASKVDNLKDGFKSLLTGGVSKLGSALGSLASPVTMTVAAFALIAGVVKGSAVLIDNLIYTSQERIEDMNKALEANETRINSLSDTLSGITEKKDSFNNLSAELDKLTQGTVEYEQARQESNDIIREILEANPELRSMASYENGQWTPDSNFWEEYKKNTTEALTMAQNAKAVLSAEKADAELDQSIDNLGVATDRITDAEQKNIQGAAKWGAIGVGGVAGVAAIATAAIASILTGGAAIPVILAGLGVTAAAAGVGAGAGGGIAALISKTGEKEEDTKLRLSKLSSERGATFTDEEIKKYAEGIFEGPEAQSLLKEVFNDDEAAAKSFFSALDGSSAKLNDAINALNANTAQLSEMQYNATEGDPNGKYYYSTEAVAADKQKAFDDVEKAVNWVSESKEQSSIIESTGKTVGEYLDNILQNKEGYSKDSKGRWTYQGKLLDIEKGDELYNQLAAEVAADYQKQQATKRKTEYNSLTAEEQSTYKQYQTERVKTYKDSDKKVEKGTLKDWKNLSEDQQKSFADAIGVDIKDLTDQQKRVAAYIQNEAKTMAGDDEAKAAQYFKAALDNYSSTYDLKDTSQSELIDAIKEGVSNSSITLLNSEENKTLDKWGTDSGDGSKLEKASEDARKVIYKFGTDFEAEGKEVVKIFNSLGNNAEDIFGNADFSTKEGIDNFVKQLQDGGITAEQSIAAFGVPLEELSSRLSSLAGIIPSITDRAESAASAYELANQIAQEAMTSFSQEQYDLITKMDSDLSDAFFQIGDAFYYTEGSAYQLAQALSTAAAAAVEDYEKVLNREEGIEATDYNKLSDDQKKNWKYNKETGKYEVSGNVGAEEYQAMMKTMGYSYEKALEYAAQLGDVNAILNSTAPEEKKTKALKAMALQYGAAAEELQNLTNEELANLVTTKKQEKQVEASTKALEENVEKLEDLKKGTSAYKSMMATMAEEINVLGGTEGIVDSTWVEQHLSDIQAMVNGDEAAAERVRKAWNKAWVESQISAETALGKIIKDAGITGDKLDKITDTLYEFKLKGTADFTQIYNALIAAGQKAEDVIAALQEIAGTDIELEYEYEYVDIIAAHTPEDKKISDQVIKDMQTTGWEEYGSSGDTRRFRYPKSVKAVKSTNNSKRDTAGNWDNFKGFSNSDKDKSSSSSSTETPWENPYDRLYNLTQQINSEIRKRNRLESEYNRLVERGLGNASQLAEKTEQERKSLEQQKALQEKLLAERKADLEKLNSNQYSKYARYDMATGNVIIDYSAINKNKDNDLGKAIEDQVSKLEDIKSEIESAEDALWDIEDQLYELTQRGRDEYIDFQKDIYNALIKQRQDEIDKYSEYISTLSEAKNDILDELRKYIDKQRQERDNAEKEKEIADKDAQLFRMERDTGSTQSDIIAARKDVEDMRRDYTDELIDQKIDELEEQNDKAQEVREKQLELMQKQLEQDQESGALWAQVKVLMEEGWGEDGKIIEGSELESILADYYEYTQMSDEERQKSLEERDINTTVARQYLNNKNAGKNNYTPSTSYPSINNTPSANQTPKKNPSSSSSGTKTLAVGSRVRTVGYGNAASDGSGGRAAKGLSNRKILKIRKGAKYPYLIGTSNDPSGWTGWYTASALQAYKSGGLANFTGPAWLDGTKSKPEAILNARDTQNFIQLRDILGSLLNGVPSNTEKTENNGDNYYDIDIQVDKLSNDYDVDKLVTKIKREITKDANYRNVRTINLKR